MIMQGLCHRPATSLDGWNCRGKQLKKILSRAVVGMAAGAVFVAGFLFAARLLTGGAGAMPVGKRVEGTDFSVLAHPVLLSGQGPLPGCLHRLGRGDDRVVDARQEAAVIAPFALTYAACGGGHEARVIFLAVLQQQRQAFGGFLFAGNQFAQLARGLVKTHLRKIEERL